jgi:flagellar basal body-associated protein FliL
MADEKAEESKDAKANAETPAPKGAKSGALLVIIVGVLVLVLTPAASFMASKLGGGSGPTAVSSGGGGHGGGGGEESKGGEGAKSGEGGGHGGGGKAATAEPNQMLALKSILVNVAETKGTRILKIEPHLVLSDSKQIEKLQLSYMPMLVDRVILAASRKTIDELEGPQGRESLKREIMGEINGIIKERFSVSVVDVYFNEFLVQ